MQISTYDRDCSTFTPTGKVLQVEYAEQAINHGSLCVGIKGQKYAVLASLKKSKSKLSGFQEKIFKIDDAIGMGITGINSDARVLCKYLRNECINHRYVYETAHPLQRLLNKVCEKAQKKTMKSYLRPYGVGLLVIGYDQDGPHLYETGPAGILNEYHAYALGAKNAPARTYFTSHVETFSNASLENLTLHALKALKEAHKDENELTTESVDLSVVSQEGYVAYTPEQIGALLERLPSFKPEDLMGAE